jgi:hypothetical protein
MAGVASGSRRALAQGDVIMEVSFNLLELCAQADI